MGRSVTGRQHVTATARDERHIRAIPTRYDGVLYRSRLEARYAVFFDTLRKGGLNAMFAYEPQGFDVDGTPYLPDFLLAGQSLIAEVKPDFGTDPDGVLRWICLIEARGKERGVLLTDMHSGPMEFMLIGPQKDGDHWEAEGATWLVCPAGYHLDIQRVPPIGCGECGLTADYWYDDERIAQAFAAARSHRFERR